MTARVFVLSPASCAGERARFVFDEHARFDLARRLRTRDGAPLGEVMSFLSGLYFRGKLAYALRFACPPVGVPGVLVITPCQGLKPPETRVDLTLLRRYAAVSINAANAAYRRPLVRDARELATALRGAPPCEVVLLGSVATGKYGELLGPAFGERLVFPPDFVGRGDMSRGGLLLRCVDEDRELDYMPLAGAVRHGARPPRLSPKPGILRRAIETLRSYPGPAGLANARPMRPSLVLLVGLPGSGKSSFFRTRFAGTHDHVSRDLLRQRGDATRRQREHVESSLRRGGAVVVDNTNATVEERARWLVLGRALGARLVGYYFGASVQDCLARNRQRPEAQRVPDVAIHVAAARFQTPALAEGFDELFRVQLLPAGGFAEEPLRSTLPGPTSAASSPARC